MESCYPHYLSLRQEMDAWLVQTKQMDPPSRHGGGEDEANYALSWFPHYLVTGKPGVAQHFEYLRDLLAGWVGRDCEHGYEPEAEAHHGTEPFLLFLPRFLGLFPNDKVARDLLSDAAEHIGNWVNEIPSWFDWDRNRFWGYRIGTRVVNQDPAQVVELAEHFRFVHIALAAHRVLGQDRYLEWALRYGRRRAEMILAVPEGPLPLMWGAQGEPLWQDDLTDAQDSMSASSHHVAGDPAGGVEVLLASGAIYVLGDLFRASRESLFRDAALRIVEPIVHQLGDPYADPSSAALSYYRWAFEDDCLDARILDMVSRMAAEEQGELVLLVPETPRMVLPGPGKRSDMIHWGVQTQTQRVVSPVSEPCSATLALAYQMTGEIQFAQRALRQAHRKLRIARRVLRGGREHADMGGAICSVAAGHGRNWGWGAVTGCYGPLILGTNLVMGAVSPRTEVRPKDGSGLPEDLMCLVSQKLPGNSEITCYNGGNTQTMFEWRKWGGDWDSASLEPGSTIILPLETNR